MRQQAGVVTGDGGICFIVLGEKLKEGSRRTSSEVLPEGDAPPGAGTGQFSLSEFVSFRKENLNVPEGLNDGSLARSAWKNLGS